jgi:hypothetical protein
MLELVASIARRKCAGVTGAFLPLSDLQSRTGVSVGTYTMRIHYFELCEPSSIALSRSANDQTEAVEMLA